MVNCDYCDAVDLPMFFDCMCGAFTCEICHIDCVNCSDTICSMCFDRGHYINCSECNGIMCLFCNNHEINTCNACLNQLSIN